MSSHLKIECLSANSLVATDGSKALTSSTSSLTPSFSGLEMKNGYLPISGSTGNDLLTVESKSASANIQIKRQSTAAVSQLIHSTGSVNEWITGTPTPGSVNYKIRDDQNGVNVLDISPGTTPISAWSGWLQINNSSAPSSNPSSSGYLYSESGAGKWKGSSGTVTTFGPADPHCPVCDSDFGLEWGNNKYGGTLRICMKCLSNELGQRDYIRWETDEIDTTKGKRKRTC
jgi:hypothetical protein